MFYINYGPEVLEYDALLTDKEGLVIVDNFISGSNLFNNKKISLVNVTMENYFDSEEIEFLVYEMTSESEVFFIKVNTRTGSIVELTWGLL